ncbi:MAG: hypothetical protein JW760_12095 [Spirochaetales bacterium]|nr:hypothetical protein [Spirochaetales bacterium]
MKKCTYIILVLLLAVLNPLAAQEKPIITVLDFSVDGVSEAEMRSIINVLSSALFKGGVFTVIDVSQRENVLKEMEFSMSGCTNESCYLEVGKLLSAEGIVVGSLGKVGSRYVLSVKLLKTETAATVSTADGMYADLDKLLDGINEVALELGEPYRETAVTVEEPAPAVAEAAPEKPEKPVREKHAEPLSINIPAWVSVAGGLGCLGTGAYFLAISLPLFIDFIEARRAYRAAEDEATAEELYLAADTAWQAALAADVNTNLTIGAGLTAAGIGLGVLSAVLFFPKDKTEAPPVETAFLPVPGGMMLAFRVRY